MGRDVETRARLERLRARIRGWRLSRPKPRRMPEPLWQEAGALAARMGVSHVAAELGLGYESLKSRASECPSAVVSAGFVEVTGAQVLGERPVAVAPVIELMDADGTRLTITLPAATHLEVTAVVTALRRRS
jgi:hypothetical protein